MRVLITGGGTGGHVYPALAVGQGLKRQSEDSEVLFVGTTRGVEKDAVPRAGFNLRFVRARGLSGNPLRKGLALLESGVGFMQSRQVLKEFRPDVVVGTGGYVSAPIVAAAASAGIPVVLLEANVVAGKTVRLLSRFARRICASFEDSLAELPRDKTVVTGNPVRPEIMERTRREGRERLGLPQDGFVLLVTGASQGARSINEAVVQALPHWQPLHVLHLTGRSHFDTVRAQTEGVSPNYHPVAYQEDMASAYAAADLIVCRAGATTLAELTCRGLPAIMVPYPFAADNHQEQNARRLEKRGACVVVADRGARERLGEVVLELYRDAERRRVMAEASQALGRPRALDAILEVVEQVVHESRRG
ncbi:MAG: undecaprenyldiphospho-muramoylpentapeptide beta-N-acetylglucosaminyltransferase [Candidatus Xenobia bacterium]